MIELSVIIPVYNAGENLRKCLDSILIQENVNIEVILINDGSIDNSGEICDFYAENYKNIDVYHISNRGVSEARNLGIKMAKGKYLTFVDADDYIAQNMYERLITIAEEYSLDAVMCNYYRVDQNFNIIEKPVHSVPVNKVLNKSEIKKYILSQYYNGNQIGIYSVWNKIFSKHVIDKNNLIMDKEMYMGEDAWFNFEFFNKANRVSAVEDSYYFYTVNPNSVMHSYRSDLVEAWIILLKKLLDANKILNFDINYDKFYKQFLTNVCFYFVMIINSTSKSNIDKKNIIYKVINNPFYKEAIKYSKNLDKKVKILILITKYLNNWSTFYLYKCVGVLYKIKEKL